MKRNAFLISGLAASLALRPSMLRAQTDPFDPRPGTWHTYRVTTDVMLAPGGAAQAWIPIPSFRQAAWMLPGPTTTQSDTAVVEIVRDERWDATQFVHARWRASTAPRRLRVVSEVTTTNYYVDLSRPQTVEPLSDQERERYLAPTAFVPTSGIVKSTADSITAGASSDIEKARRIYQWVVERTYRKPSTRGCGLGNISFLLESGDLGGKCADLNGLAVGLARAAGIPARDLYGIRVGPSRFGYHSLGANSPIVTKAQHCRAEFFLAGYGWVPVDPADVRKVMLEEPPGNLSIDDSKVRDARATLFGAWEGNYLAYNDAQDVPLPGIGAKPVPFLMYPQGEIGGEALDSLDPADFMYEISASAAKEPA